MKARLARLPAADAPHDGERGEGKLPGGASSPRNTLARSVRSLGLPAILAALCACHDSLPRDPRGTLERVLETRVIRVAAVEHVPWVILDTPVPTGAEVALVRDFAAKLKVEVQWLHAPMFEALEALDRGDADLAIGGFAEEAVSAHPHVGPTYAYFEDALVVAAPPDVDIPNKLSDQRVEVAPGLLSAGLIEEKGGVPVPPGTEGVALVALPHWQLESQSLVPTGIVLLRQPRVMAVPQGENGWLMKLERFLRDRRTALDSSLRAYAE